MPDLILTEARDGLLIVTLNRPDARNAMNNAMMEALDAVLRQAASDSAVRAVVLTGAGGSFCVGGDVKAMNAGAGRDMTDAQRHSALRARMDVSQLLHDMPKPTIAAIEGPAAGAGLSLALACDFRICASDSKLTTAFAKVGLSGDFGGTYFLTQIVGAAKARELYLLSPILMGAEAARLGLVNDVTDPGQALTHACELGARLANGPTQAYGRIKANIAHAEAGNDLAACLDLEATNFIATSNTGDHREAAAAFVAKRAPAFKGQ